MEYREYPVMITNDMKYVGVVVKNDTGAFVAYERVYDMLPDVRGSREHTARRAWLAAYLMSQGLPIESVETPWLDELDRPRAGWRAVEFATLRVAMTTRTLDAAVRCGIEVTKLLARCSWCVEEFRRNARSLDIFDIMFDYEYVEKYTDVLDAFSVH